MQDTGVVSRLQGSIQDQYCGEHTQLGRGHESGDCGAKPCPMEGIVCCIYQDIIIIASIARSASEEDNA